MRASHGGADLWHGDGAHVDVVEFGIDGEDIPTLIICGESMQVVVAPALDDWPGAPIEIAHVQFARQLAEGAYRYLELLATKCMESPTAA